MQRFPVNWCPPGSAEQIRPTWTISDLHRVWMHARNVFLSPLLSILNTHIKYYIINLLSDAFHLKKDWQVTSVLWVWTTALYHGLCYFILKFHDALPSLIYFIYVYLSIAMCWCFLLSVSIMVGRVSTVNNTTRSF
jgi:hypothetical protein